MSARVLDHETDRLPRIEAEKVIGTHPVGFGQAEVNYPNAYDAAGGLGGQKPPLGGGVGLQARSAPIQSIRFTSHASPKISPGVEGWPRSTHCRDRLSCTPDTVRVERLDRGKLVGDLPEPVASRLSRAPVAHRDRAAAF